MTQYKRRSLIKGIGVVGALSMGGSSLLPVVSAQGESDVYKNGKKLRYKLGTSGMGHPQEIDTYKQIIKALKKRKKKLEKKIDNNWDWPGISDKVDEWQAELEKIKKLLHMFVLMLTSVQAERAGGGVVNDTFCNKKYQNYRIGVGIDILLNTFADWTLVLGYIPFAHIDDAATLWTIYNLFKADGQIDESKAKKVRKSDEFKKLKKKLQKKTGKSDPSRKDVENAFSAAPTSSGPSLASPLGAPPVNGISTGELTPDAACGPDSLVLQLGLSVLGKDIRDEMPGPLRGLANDKVNIVVDNSDGWNRIVGADLNTGYVESLVLGGYMNPSVDVKLSDNTARRILKADDRVATARQEYNRNNVEIKGRNLVSTPKYACVTFLEDIGLFG